MKLRFWHVRQSSGHWPPVPPAPPRPARFPPGYSSRSYSIFLEVRGGEPLEAQKTVDSYLGDDVVERVITIAELELGTGKVRRMRSLYRVEILEGVRAFRWAGSTPWTYDP